MNQRFNCDQVAKQQDYTSAKKFCLAKHHFLSASTKTENLHKQNTSRREENTKIFVNQTVNKILNSKEMTMF